MFPGQHQTMYKTLCMCPYNLSVHPILDRDSWLWRLFSDREIRLEASRLWSRNRSLLEWRYGGSRQVWAMAQRAWRGICLPLSSVIRLSDCLSWACNQGDRISTIDLLAWRTYFRKLSTHQKYVFKLSSSAYADLPSCSACCWLDPVFCEVNYGVDYFQW